MQTSIINPTTDLGVRHKELVTKLKSGDVSLKLRNEYCSNYLALLRAEFENPKAIEDPESLRKWRGVVHVLIAEECPVAYEPPGSSGCSHLHFGSALYLFVRKALHERCFSFLGEKVLPRLKSLLENFQQISTTNNILRYHPHPEQLDYEMRIREFLEQGNFTQIGSYEEFLFPIAYLVPDTKKGHFLLCKVKRAEIQLFNALPLANDKPCGTVSVHNKVARIYQLRCVHTITRNDDFESTMNDVLATLPFVHAGYMVQKLGEHPEPKELHRKAMEAIYTRMQHNGTLIETTPTLFSYVQYTEGNICVAMAFRMLLLSLTDEAVAKADLPLQEHHQIKAQCDSFWQCFKVHMASIQRIFDPDIQ